MTHDGKNGTVITKVTKVSFNEKFSIQVKGKQPKDFKKSKIFYLISWTFRQNKFRKKNFLSKMKISLIFFKEKKSLKIMNKYFVT